MRALLVVLALGVAPVLVRLLPGPSDDSLRTTLSLLPALLAAVLAIEAWMRRQGLAALSSQETRWIAGLLAGLVLTTLSWRSLGLGMADRLIFAGFVLLLLHWVSRALMRLRPLLDSTSPNKTPVVFFWLPLLFYVALIPWSTEHRPPDGDEPHNLLLTHSLAYDFDTDLKNNYLDGDSLRFLPRRLEPQPGDPVGSQGELYSRHNMALPLVLAPVYRVAGKLGVLVLMAVFTAALAWQMLHLALHYYPRMPGKALLAYALFAFAPPLLLYAHQVWVEIPAALLVAIGLNGTRRLSRDRPIAQQKAIAVHAILPILLLPLLKIRFVVLAISLLGLLWWRKGRRSLAASAVGGGVLAIGIVGVLVFNQARFGNPLKVFSLGILNLSDNPVLHLVRGLGGLFFDGAFGLFLCAPLWLILVPAVYEAVRRRDELLMDTLLVSGPYLSAVSLTTGWYGGWSPPFRLGIAVLPLFALLLVPMLEVRRRLGAQLVLGALSAATLVMALIWVLEPGLTYDWPNGTMRLSEYLGARLGIDLSNLLPSFVRIRPATYIWPVAALLAAVVWRLPMRRRASASALGATLLLLTLTLAGYVASHLPTRRVEFEDAFVRKTGGSDYPGQWSGATARNRLSWRLPEGHRIQVPIVAGGTELSLEIVVRKGEASQSATTLRLLTTRGELGRLALEPSRAWHTLHFGPYSWQPGDRLTLDLVASGAEPDNSILLDRMRLTWK